MAGGSTTRTEPWAEQKPYLQQGFQQAQGLYNQGPPAFYPGQTLAGFSPAQQMAQQATMGYAMGPRPAAQQAAAEKALIGGLSGGVDMSTFSPMVSALSQGVQSNLQQNILPGIRESLVRTQPGGGSRGDLVQNQAIANAVTSGMTKPLAEMYTSAYQGAQGRVPQFAQQYPTIMGAPMGMYGAMGDVGAEQRAMQQERINQQQRAYEYTAQAPMNALQQYMANISGDYGGTTRQSPSALQGIGQIASIASMFSDVRVKENIAPTGKTYRGHNVYDFNYIGDDNRYRGVMAQEVEQTRPDAVGEVNGIKYVNYGDL